MILSTQIKPAAWSVIGLVALVLAVFGQIIAFDFVNYDDDINVYQNHYVRMGLTLTGLKWALTTREDYWRPLTRLSHMVDAQIYGMWAGGHHLTNVLLHLANTLLLFGVMRTLFDQIPMTVLGRDASNNSSTRLVGCAFLAALFAIHPLQVESVAWITERKDVLSGFFVMLTLWAYLRHVQRRTWSSYALVAFAFGCALMSKPTVAPLPVGLLLLDTLMKRGSDVEDRGQGLKQVTGLPDAAVILEKPAVDGKNQRTGIGEIVALLPDKIPLLLMASIPFWLAMGAVRGLGFDPLMDALPVDQRVALPVVAMAGYLLKLVWPVGLAVYYPHPLPIPAWQMVLCGLGLIGITVAAVMAWHRHRLLAVGWSWCLVMMIPSAGLMYSVGMFQCDRYVYVAMIGLLLAVTGWMIQIQRKPWGIRFVMRSLLIGAVLLPAYNAQKQTTVWENSQTLFRHALAAGHESAIAHHNLGAALAEESRMAEAEYHWRKALKLKPSFELPQIALGILHAQNKRYDEAIAWYSNMLQRNPRSTRALVYWGDILIQQGEEDSGIEKYKEALRINLCATDALIHLGTHQLRERHLDHAEQTFRHALDCQPFHKDAILGLADIHDLRGNHAEAIRLISQEIRADKKNATLHSSRGYSFLRMGRLDDATRDLETATRLDPMLAVAHFNLGVIRAKRGQLEEAMASYRAAAALNQRHETARNNLGNLLARQGRLNEAMEQYHRVLTINPENSDSHNNRGSVFFLQGKFDEAIAAYQEAVRLAPDRHDYRRNLEMAVKSRNDRLPDKRE